MSAFNNPQGMGEGLVLGEASPDCKLVVVGVDFGTGYSGIAYAFKSDQGTIECGGPSAADATQIKVPTVLLELEDGQWEFGYAAEAKYNQILLNHTATGEQGAPLPVHLYRRFKMVLKGKNAGFDTILAMSLDGKSHKLIDLISVSLSKLKDYAMQKVNARYGKTISAVQDVQWVLTVPAIWNDFGKAFMRKAAFRAGMIDDEQSDNLMLVLEPEGASLAVHVGIANNSLLGVGSRFLVLDCGAGTVDITAHEVLSTRPLYMKSIAVPTGGEWGGDYVNVEFKKFLRNLLGPDLYDEQASPREFNIVYSEFDKVKMAFNPDADPAQLRLVDVLEDKSQLMQLAMAYNNAHPEKQILMSKPLERGFLTMSKELMLSFFEPFLLATLTETRAVMKSTMGIRHIMVVGGFGSSATLINRIRNDLHNKGGVKVLLPNLNPRPQAAIMHGAVHFGLHKDVIRSRVSPYTYGVAVRRNEIDEVFGVLVHKGQELPLDHVACMTGVPAQPTQDALTWCIYRSNDRKPTTVVGAHLLGELQVLCPFDEDESKRKQKGQFHFGGSELKVTVENASGEVFRKELSMI